MEQTQITRPGTSLMDKATQEFADEFERLAQQAAAGQEQPMGTQKVSRAQMLSLWGRHDPKVDYGQVLAQLMATGLSQPMLTVPDGASVTDPARQWLMIAKEQPDLIPQLGATVADPGLAHRLAVICEYPFRLGTLQDIDDPDEQVRLANSLDREWSGSHATEEAADEPTPTPEQVAPQPQPAAPMMPDPMAPAGAMQSPPPTSMMGGA